MYTTLLNALRTVLWWMHGRDAIAKAEGKP